MEESQSAEKQRLKEQLYDFCLLLKCGHFSYLFFNIFKQVSLKRKNVTGFQ